MTPINQKIAELSLQEAALRRPTIYIRGVKVTNIDELFRELEKLEEEEEVIDPDHPEERFEISKKPSEPPQSAK